MNEIEPETEESGWTKENLQKLLAAMKTGIPKRRRMCPYTTGLKDVDWEKVAFPPFSPEACQEKWGEILQKMRKTRSLMELIGEAEDVISNAVQNKKIHPERPKRPHPPHAIFYKENYVKFREQHPNMAYQKLFRLLYKKYNMLPDEAKAPYVEKYKLATEEYNRRMLKFRKQYCKSSRCDRQRKWDSPDGEECTEDAEGLPPKPPANGYNLFCKEQSGSIVGKPKNGSLSVWAQRWRDLTERERDEYNTHCTELKRQYSIKLNEYLMTMDEEEQQRILDEHGIKRPKAVKKGGKLSGEPEMPPGSGNLVFCKDQMELLRGKFPTAECFKRISQIWKDLSNTEKERYEGKGKENIRKFSMELQKWFKTLTPAEQKKYQICNPSKCQYLGVEQVKVCDQKESLKKPLKRQYLHAKQVKVSDKEESLNRTSDSEDEDIEDSSSDEEEDYLDCEEDKEEDEEGDDIAFELY